MIVRRSTLEQAQRELKDSRYELQKAESTIERLHANIRNLQTNIDMSQIELAVARDRINTLELLNRVLKGTNAQPSCFGEQFTQEEIKRLIQLCHPDKHDGKQSAVEITAKLIGLKK